MGSRSKTLFPGGKPVSKSNRSMRALRYDFPWAETMEKTLLYVEDHPDCDMFEVARDVHNGLLSCAQSALNTLRNKGRLTRRIDKFGMTRYTRTKR